MNRSAFLTRLTTHCRRGAIVVAVATAVAMSVASAQQAGARITPNFKDADITQIAEAVQAATGKTFIIDPRVRAQVTMLANTPMTSDEFYQTFLAILQVHGFIAVPSGRNIVKILPDANARQFPANDLPDNINAKSDEIVTQVISVKNVSAAQLVPILRPLIPQYGHLAAYPASNVLIISDRANNVARIMRIIARIDLAGDSEVEVVVLQNASAAEIVRVVNTLYPAQAQAEGGGTPLKVVADDRSNSILISGEPSNRLRVKGLVTILDTPLEAGGETQVRYLRYADAEKIAAKLKEQITGVTQAAPGAAGAQGAPPSAAAEKASMVWADPETNALVMTAPPKIMRSLMSVVDRLDIRRMQVLVEAIVVDVSLNKSADLGVNWAVFSEEDDTRIPAATFLGPVGGVSLVDLAAEVDSPGSSGKDLSGTTIGLGRIARNNGISFAAMLRALRSDDNSNIIATPSAVTMDNQEAQIKVAQEVPFRTGSFTNTGGTNGSVNPFTTIQRQEVGTILKLTPQINEGNAVVLKIELESSSVAPTIAGAADLITNKRTISTNVLIEDGGIIVLGGLISENFNRTETRVPFLGRIPVLGLLFKSRTGQNQKTNLMVFIKPTILRDGQQTAIATNSKYQYIREQQKQVGKREILPILPGVKQPILPPPPEPPPASSEDSTTSQDGKRKSSDDPTKTKQQQEQQAQPRGADQSTATPQPAPQQPTPPPSPENRQ